MCLSAKLELYPDSVPVKKYEHKYYVSTIFQILFSCSARGNVSYLFFFLREKHTTFYGRLHVLYVSTI
jgi:hypothetical protein